MPSPIGFSTPKIFNEEQAYLEEWTHSSRLLFYSVVLVSFIALPCLLFSFFYIRCFRRSTYLPYLCSILLANVILLSTLLVSILTENTEMVYEFIPGFVVCKVTAFLVNTSSCFIHWTWVVMYAERFAHVFFPLRIRRAKPWKSSVLILCVLLLSSIIQIWTPIFITGRRLDYNSNNQFDNIYCGEDPSFSSQSQKIVIVECIITFFIPLFLTILADISVLVWKNSCSGHFTLISNDEIGGKVSRKKSHMKIVSSNSLKMSQKRRSNAIRRCLISATITLFLNLPNYSLQLLDEFYNLRDNPSIDVRRIFLRIDAFVYVLYLMQFPITPIHIFILSRTSTYRRSSTRSNPNSLRIDHHNTMILNNNNSMVLQDSV